MSSYKLKEITEASYILEKDGSNAGLVTITAEGFKVIGPFDRKLFMDADELTAYLGGSLQIEARETDDDKDDEIGQINGYPIKHKAVFDVEEGDIVFTSHGVKVVVDPLSINYIKGANVDYVDDVMGGGFKIDNPNATKSCGCGSSFGTEDGPEGGSCGSGGGGCGSGCGCG